MQIRVLSDLHLEFRSWTPPPVPADVVVLAGDIHSGVEGIHWGRQHFPDSSIVYVPGNHEFYGTGLEGMLGEMREAAQRADVHLLDANAVVIDGVRFLGATLWTDFALHGAEPEDIAHAMSIAQSAKRDFRTILLRDAVPLSPGHTRDIHRLQTAWLRHELAQPFAARTVVVTHHLPHPQSIPPKYQGDQLNPCFASDLSSLLRAPVNLWIHGHTHASMDYEVRGTRVVCNPRGYLPHDPNADFNPELVVELGG